MKRIRSRDGLTIRHHVVLRSLRNVYVPKCVLVLLITVFVFVDYIFCGYVGLSYPTDVHNAETNRFAGFLSFFFLLFHFDKFVNYVRQVAGMSCGGEFADNASRLSSASQE